MNSGELDLLKSEIQVSEEKIKLADELLENGTIEHKINFIVSDIRQRENRKKLENEQRLRIEVLNSYILRGIKI